MLVKQPGALGAAEPPLNGAPLFVDLPPQLGEPRNYTDNPQHPAIGLLRVPGVAVAGPVNLVLQPATLAGSTEVVVSRLVRAQVFHGLPAHAYRSAILIVGVVEPAMSRFLVLLGSAHCDDGDYALLDRVLEVWQGVVALVSQHELGFEPRVTLQRIIQVLGDMARNLSGKWRRPGWRV